MINNSVRGISWVAMAVLSTWCARAEIPAPETSGEIKLIMLIEIWHRRESVECRDAGHSLSKAFVENEVLFFKTMSERPEVWESWLDGSMVSNGSESLQIASGASAASRDVPFPEYVAVWRDPETDTALHIEIENGVPTFKKAVDNSGEIYQRVASDWTDGVMTFAYHVPSTGRQVRWAVVGRDGSNLDTLWESWDGDEMVSSGSETLELIR